MLRLLIVLMICIAPIHAMLSDGIHPPKDYVKFVETQEAFRASCSIYDRHRHVLQTGVLIAPDIVMTAAHGFEGHFHLDGIIVGFGDTISLESDHNYAVKAYRTHPRFYQTPYPTQAKYDILFFKLTKPVKGIEPVPLFEEKTINEIPPLYVATFGSADIPQGAPVHRRAFTFPETDLFSVMGRDPETLYERKTVMMGSVFFEPMDILKPVNFHSNEREIRTYHANFQWQKMGKPPYALTLAGSSGAPIFINLPENGKLKTYVFGIIQSFSHLSTSSFQHFDKDSETQRLLRTNRNQVYGKYQSVFCIPYKLTQALKKYTLAPRIFQLSPKVKNIIKELEEPHPPSTVRKPTSLSNSTRKGRKFN